MEHATPLVLLLLLVFTFPVVICIARACRGRVYRIRRIPGIDALDEAVGRAVELGRPISFSTALTSLSPLFYACLGVMRYVARKAARYNSKFIVPVGDPEAFALSEATIQSAYRDEKRSNSFDPASLRYLSSEQFAFASGYVGLVQREQPGATFLFGTFAAEALILAEAGQRVGAVQVAASAAFEQVPFFITTCDYTLIGEEIYAAGAYLSEDPVHTGSLRGQDIGKLIVICLVIVGIAHATILSFQGAGATVPYPGWIALSWQDLFGWFSKTFLGGN